MTDLFTPTVAPTPLHNLLPYDGIVNDFGILIEDSDLLFNQLLTELPWQADKVTLFGKTHITKRHIVWMGNSCPDNALSYRYSGHTRPITPWNDTVLAIKQRIERELADKDIPATFNTCLLNYYPSGEAGMGYHADDEPEMGHQPVIASVSLGATRKFVLKHKKIQHKVALNLESGQLIIMRGDTQRYWKHTLTKTTKVDTGRISLTFRQLRQPHQ